ncbi:MAG TPA: hypothetical protein VH040_06445 [Usitatibacter sp.]|jgi:hypothetical protein|nr:hypothetical protein [Usitatibacter sp.]
MKNLLAIGIACLLPAGLVAEDQKSSEADLGTTSVLVIDEALPDSGNVACNQGCMAFNRAVLTARTQKVSVLRSRGRWI